MPPENMAVMLKFHFARITIFISFIFIAPQILGCCVLSYVTSELGMLMVETKSILDILAIFSKLLFYLVFYNIVKIKLTQRREIYCCYQTLIIKLHF